MTWLSKEEWVEKLKKEGKWLGSEEWLKIKKERMNGVNSNWKWNSGLNGECEVRKEGRVEKSRRWEREKKEVSIWSEGESKGYVSYSRVVSEEEKEELVEEEFESEYVEREESDWWYIRDSKVSKGRVVRKYRVVGRKVS